MKKYSISLFFFTFAVLFISKNLVAAETLVSSQNIVHSHVYGYFNFPLNPTPVDSNTLRITTTCPNVGIASVEYTSSADQIVAEITHVQPGGVIKQRGNKFYSLRLNFYAPGHYAFTCGWNIYATGGTVVNPDEEELVGILRYTGGYVRRLSLPLNPSRVVKSFRVAMPSFCGNVDVLEAGTLSENVFDSAKLVQSDTKTFTVNDGAGMRVSSIAATLNGPASACNIPVYANKN